MDHDAKGRHRGQDGALEVSQLASLVDMRNHIATTTGDAGCGSAVRDDDAVRHPRAQLVGHPHAAVVHRTGAATAGTRAHVCMSVLDDFWSLMG